MIPLEKLFSDGHPSLSPDVGNMVSSLSSADLVPLPPQPPVLVPP